MPSVVLDASTSVLLQHRVKMIRYIFTSREELQPMIDIDCEVLKDSLVRFVASVEAGESSEARRADAGDILQAWSRLYSWTGSVVPLDDIVGSDIAREIVDLGLENWGWRLGSLPPSTRERYEWDHFYAEHISEVEGEFDFVVAFARHHTLSRV